MAAVHLFSNLPQIKTTNQMASRLFRFSRLVLIQSAIGQYFSSLYFWAIAAAMLQSKVAAIAVRFRLISGLLRRNISWFSMFRG